MKSIFSVTVFSFFAVVLFASSVKAQTAGKISLDSLAGNKITGAWRINYTESDNLLLKMQTLLQNKLTQTADRQNISANGEVLPTMSVSLVPPENLMLAGNDEKSITINEGYSEIVFTRTFVTDGKQRSGELQNGTVFALTATQHDNSLKVETVSPRGNKMTESYEISGEGKKLIVTVRFETAQAQEIMTLRRVYDRSMPDVFSDDAEQIQ